MRDKFSELINNGVAAFDPKPVASSTPELDPMCRKYNAVWGLLTDTHMSKIDDDYIITGTFTQSVHWDVFKYTYNWGTTNFKLASGYCSLDNMVSDNQYIMIPDIYNGDHIIRLTKKKNDVNLGCEECPDQAGCTCSQDCPTCCTVGESNIPKPLFDVFSHNQVLEFRSAWINAEGDANKIIENLKSSKVLDGDKFYISSDQKYLIGLGNETIKFKL